MQIRSGMGSVKIHGNKKTVSILFSFHVGVYPTPQISSELLTWVYHILFNQRSNKFDQSVSSILSPSKHFGQKRNPWASRTACVISQLCTKRIAWEPGQIFCAIIRNILQSWSYESDDMTGRRNRFWMKKIFTQCSRGHETEFKLSYGSNTDVPIYCSTILPRK